MTCDEDRYADIAAMLAGLPGVYEEALRTRVLGARGALHEAGGVRSMTVVGSGASYAAAVYGARFFSEFLGIHARATTPYDYLSATPTVGTGLFLVTAGGRNMDALATSEHAVAHGINPVIVATRNTAERVSRALTEYDKATIMKTPDLSGVSDEGFLGFQSLIGSVGAILALDPRIREIATASDPRAWIESVVSETVNGSDFPEHVKLLADVEHIVALGTGWSFPAAIDFESKLVEGGLGWISLAETKNFTHGRYMNVALRPRQSAVIVFATAGQARLTEFITRNLESWCPVVPIVAGTDSAIGGIELFVRMFHLVRALAEERGVEIVRPSVPGGAGNMFRGDGLYLGSQDRGALEAYAGATVRYKCEALEAERQRDTCVEAEEVSLSIVRASLADMMTTEFDGIALDFDGTLVDLNDRAAVLEGAVVEQLARLLSAGVQVAVITARGRSALRDLRSSFAETLLSSIHCYLYSGAARWQASDPTARWIKPLPNAAQIHDLLEGALSDNRSVEAIETAALDCQVTVHLVDASSGHAMTVVVDEILSAFGMRDLVVRTSGRSVDIVARGASKAEAMSEFRESLRTPTRLAPRILAVGDRGERGGNDHELLNQNPSFSVGGIHWASHVCFPVLAPTGERLSGPMGTIALLESMSIEQGGRFRMGLFAGAMHEV